MVNGNGTSSIRVGGVVIGFSLGGAVALLTSIFVAVRSIPTKEDIAQLRAELKAEVLALRQEHLLDMRELRQRSR